MGILFVDLTITCPVHHCGSTHHGIRGHRAQGTGPSMLSALGVMSTRCNVTHYGVELWRIPRWKGRDTNTVKSHFFGCKMILPSNYLPTSWVKTAGIVGESADGWKAEFYEPGWAQLDIAMHMYRFGAVRECERGSCNSAPLTAQCLKCSCPA